MEMKSLFRPGFVSSLRFVRTAFVPALVAAVALVSGPGCFWVTTKSEGDTLRQGIKDLDARVETKEKQFDGKVDELQKVLDDATRLLKRNSADLGADVDQLRNDVRIANGLVAAINNQMAELKASLEATRKDSETRITALEQRLGSVESGKPTANSSADDLWRLGSAAFEAQRFNDALDVFKRLLQAYPTHDRADDAQYFRGAGRRDLEELLRGAHVPGAHQAEVPQVKRHQDQRRCGQAHQGRAQNQGEVLVVARAGFWPAPTASR
jgi:tetratricopeptide (TPR) repeat protein